MTSQTAGRKVLDRGSSNPRIQCGECGRWMRLSGTKNGKAIQRFYGSCDVTGGDHPCGSEVCADCCPSKCQQRAASKPDLIKALERAEELFRVALPEFNWGASALSATAIMLLNEVPGEVRAALTAAKPVQP